MAKRLSIRNPQNFPILPPEIYLAITSHLKPIDSACFALANKTYYPIHRDIHGSVPLITLPIPPADDKDVFTRWNWEAYRPSLRKRLETWMGSHMMFDPIWMHKFVPRKKWIRKAMRIMVMENAEDLETWFWSQQHLRYPATLLENRESYEESDSE